MIVQVYQFTAYCSRSVIIAQPILELHVDELPEDQIAFAEQYGGDFIEILNDEP